MRKSRITRQPTSYLKRTPINKVSTKQKHELYLRRRLKKLLLVEGPHDEAGNPLCWHCEKLPDGRGLEMVHLQYLSAGGKTEHGNCETWCCPCHYGPDGHRTEIISMRRE